MRPNKIVHILFESDYDSSYNTRDSCLIYSEDTFSDDYLRVLKHLEIDLDKVKTVTIDKLKFCEVYVEVVEITTTTGDYLYNWTAGYKIFTNSDAEQKYIYKAGTEDNMLKATSEATSALVSLEIHEQKEDFFIL